jgi:hypothetical protein
MLTASREQRESKPLFYRCFDVHSAMLHHVVEKFIRCGTQLQCLQSVALASGASVA